MLMIMINANNTRPMVNNTSLCSPDAYPISATIAVVRKRTELNGRGKFTELPDTSVIAIASPMALPSNVTSDSPSGKAEPMILPVEVIFFGSREENLKRALAQKKEEK